MRKKLMALILAAGLGITGIAMTTQAAETGTNEACRHETLHRYEKLVKIINYTSRQHLYIYEVGYACSAEDCPYTTLVQEGHIYEDHDYEQTYYPDGRVESVCTICGGSYFW